MTDKIHMCILKEIPCVGYCTSPTDKDKCSIIIKKKYIKGKQMIQNKKLGIVIGHEPKRPGAYNKKLKIKEYQLNLELSAAISLECEKRKIKNIIIHRENGYQKLPYNINEKNVDYCILVHHNASSRKQINGTETLYYAKSKTSKKFAQYVNNEMVNALKYKDRGVLPRTEKDRGFHVLKNTSMPCVLIEPYFMSNNAATKNRDTKKLASSIVDGYENFLRNKQCQ